MGERARGAEEAHGILELAMSHGLGRLYDVRGYVFSLGKTVVGD